MQVRSALESAAPGEFPVSTISHSTAGLGRRAGDVGIGANEASRVAQRVNEALDAFGHGLLFLVDDENGRPVVRAVEAHSHEVLREVPMRDLLEIYESLQRYQGWLRRERF